MAQDDYYYEIQLTNKQLVFYFLAGATGLILSFLAGVMVGRGVDQSAGEVQAARPVAEERVVTEETPKPVPSAAAEDLTYAQRLESDKTDDGLEKPKGGTPSTGRAARAVTPPVTTAAAAPTTAPAAPPVTVAAVPRPAPPKAAPAGSVKLVKGPGAPISGSGNFTIQVGAFKDKASADSIVGRLKSKGFAAYVVSPEGEGLFNVRVGNFATRADAERVQGKLRDEEKYKPFIVKP
ncbi:MAG TPA: SPOR domain-containing protein [Vicinamibacteria bacterium]|nr:SPOR domain-containing protein [Vicinamibacteria bacterium]